MKPIKDPKAKRHCACGCNRNWPIADFGYIAEQERYDSYTKKHRANVNKRNYEIRRARIASKLKAKASMAKSAPAKAPVKKAAPVAKKPAVKKDKPAAIKF